MRAPADEGLAELRKALSRITAEGSVARGHVRVVERLRDTNPHSVAFIEWGDDGPHGFNCFMYSLGLRVLPPELAERARHHDAAFPGKQFVDELRACGLLLEIDEARRREGDVVLYFDDGRAVQHAGVLGHGDFVVSKWGIGNLWRHPLFEVPATYGDEALFYECPNPDDVLLAFTAYVVRVTGVQIPD